MNYYLMYLVFAVISFIVIIYGNYKQGNNLKLFEAIAAMVVSLIPIMNLLALFYCIEQTGVLSIVVLKGYNKN